MQDDARSSKETVADAVLSHALLRLALGISMLVHGLVRIGGNFWPFVDSTVKLFTSSPLPHFLLRISAMIIPPVEVLIGVLLILGLWTRFAVVLGSFEMCALIAGMSLLEQWEIVAIQLAYAFFFVVLLRDRQNDKMSVDSWIRRNRS